MTPKELAALFTLPDDKLAAARELVLKVIAAEIIMANHMALRSSGPQRRDYEQWRNGLSRAQYLIRDTIDWEGKILRADLEKYPLRADQYRALAKDNSDGTDQGPGPAGS